MLPPLAVFSPLPPCRSGIGDYVCEQLPHLARYWSPVVVIADNAPDPDPLPFPVPVHRLSDWKSDKARDYSTPRLYHLGNNLAHDYILDEVFVRAGIAILHDVNLHHGILCTTFLRGRSEEYWRLFRAEFGAESNRLGGLWIVGFMEDRHRIFELTLNRPILETLRGVVVHSAYAEHEIRARVPELPVQLVPHHYSLPANPAPSREAARERLGLPKDEAIIISAGYIGGYKQINTALRALARAKGRLPRFRYILVGDAWDKTELRIQIKRSGMSDHVMHTGFVPMATLEDYIAAADVVVTLRWPTSGESSGVVARSLGAGRCTIVYDYAAFADIPDGVAVKLPLDTRNTLALEDAVVRAVTDTEWRAAVEAAALAYARHELDIEQCVRSVSGFLHRVLDGCPPVEPSMVSNIDPDARPLAVPEAEALIKKAVLRVPDARTREYINLHANRHAQVASYFPVAQPGMSALELGCFHIFMPLFRHKLGYDTVIGGDQTPYPPHVHREERNMPHADGEDSYPCALFDFQYNRFPFEDCTFDFILCSAVVEHLGLDPMFMMSEINRILKFNGVLVIDTCNIVCNYSITASLEGYSPYLHNKYQRCRSTDRHNIEFAPRDLRQLVEAAGMRIHRFESFDCYGRQETDGAHMLKKLGMPRDLRGDEILAVGVKTTDIVDRFPSVLYEPGPVVRRSSSLGPWVEGMARDGRNRAPV